MAQRNLMGKTILGYTVNEMLGSGAFGTVYKVIKKDVSGEYVRALKHITIPNEKQYDSILNSMGGDVSKADGYFLGMLKDIVSEIRILNDLSEKGVQNIVRYYEHSIEESGSPKRYDIYILMEYLTPLTDFIKREEFTVRDVVKLGTDILYTLHLCHANRVMHRDVKDDNLFISGKGEYKIGDFGVSKVLKDSSKAESMKGTPNFLAPEVYLGKESYTRSVDLYSLGIVLYRLLNYNRNPFLPQYPNMFHTADEDRAFERRMKGDTPDFPSLGGKLIGTVIIKSISKSSERYQTAKEFIDALQGALNQTSADILNESIKISIVQSSETDEKKEKKIYQSTIGETDPNTYMEKTVDDAYSSSMNKHLFDTVGEKSFIENPKHEVVVEPVLNWQVKDSRKSSLEKMKFNSKRYIQESQDKDFLMGKKAYENENFEVARLLFSKLYAKGNRLAGCLLGEIYYSGKECEKNYDKAVSLFVDGMQSGCPLNASWLAEVYRVGMGVPQDKDKAKEIYDSCVEALEAMCVSGSADAQYFYGFDLLYGNYQIEDEKKAFYWLEKAMNAGIISAGVEVARIYLYGWGKEKDEQKGFEILQKYSNSKNKKAHFELGQVYYFGIGRECDYRKALNHFLIAAEKGHSASQVYVGDIYYYGYGVEIDYLEAKKWYEKGAEQSNKSALLKLGFIFDLGVDGISKDTDKAFYYFRLSAEQGDASAQLLLGDYYLNNEVYKDEKKAIDCFEKSAKQGVIQAQCILASCYLNAYGVEKDQGKAWDYLYSATWNISKNEKDGRVMVEEHKVLADLYYKTYWSTIYQQSAIEHAFDHYCIVFSSGNREVTFNVSFMYFIDGFDSKYLGDNTDEILQIVINEAETSESPDLAFLLGVIYGEGYRVSVDKKEAEKWYKKADEKVYWIEAVSIYNRLERIEEAYEHGSVAAIRLLGLCYKKGIGVKRNKRKARELFKEAAQKGNLDAKNELKKFIF